VHVFAGIKKLLLVCAKSYNDYFQGYSIIMARRRIIPILLCMTVPLLLVTVVRLVELYQSSTHEYNDDNDSPLLSLSMVSSAISASSSRQIRKTSFGGGGENDMFEMMHQHLYDIAHQSSSNNDKAAAGTNHNNERKKYTLDAVPKAGGGLLDDVSVVVIVVVVVGLSRCQSNHYFSYHRKSLNHNAFHLFCVIQKNIIIIPKHHNKSQPN
jgi:hypothetical protein